MIVLGTNNVLYKWWVCVVARCPRDEELLKEKITKVMIGYGCHYNLLPPVLIYYQLPFLPTYKYFNLGMGYIARISIRGDRIYLCGSNEDLERTLFNQEYPLSRICDIFIKEFDEI